MKDEKEKSLKEANQDEILAEKEFDAKQVLKHPNPEKKQHSMDDYRKTPQEKITNTIDLPQDEQQYDQHNENE